MGNQLTAIAPSQILPVEHYLSDVDRFQYVGSLGSTRFFKVAKVLTEEGLVVVKVFIVHDPSLQLKGYKIQIEEMKNSLNWTQSCMPFQLVQQTDRAVMLCRQHVQYSLYDRISTRPFLNVTEKKWIAFQLMSALDQCHKMEIFHGDIKSENVLIMSWNWVLLTDFANFKPVFLPDNNPADFSYYFDTSRRRTCYIAPERFVDSLHKTGVSENLFDIANEPTRNGELKAAMDIFSAGCVLIELFTEGAMPFDLSQLLAYRSGDYFPSKLIESIEDEGIRELVTHMIQKDPASRLSAEKYLINYRLKTFPECFYTFIKPYCQRFACSPPINADDRVARINGDFNMMVERTIQTASKEKDPTKSECFLIVLPIVFSCIKKLQLCKSKLTALDLFSKSTLYVTSDMILDRIIPHILYFVKDKFVLVRCETLRTLKFCLSTINSVPSCELNIFTEYIFPLINLLAADKEALVRMVFAENIASFAEHAIKFLEIIQLQNQQQSKLDEHSIKSKSNSEVHSFEMFKQSSIDFERQALQEFIQEKIGLLLYDKDNFVRRTLLMSGIEKLCIFFGKHKAIDNLFSHMITFLNDKRDFHLRASFFENSVGIVTYIGSSCSSILKPLLQQGLTDSEELVIVQTLSSLNAFIELGVLQKSVVVDLIKDVLPLALHPNVRIRKKVVGFVARLSKKMHIADVHIYLLPHLSNFTTREVYSLDDETNVWGAMTTPLPRLIYEQLIKSPAPLELFLDFLRKSSSSAKNVEITEGNAILMRKLISLGMTEVDRVKIMSLSEHLKVIYKSRSTLFTVLQPANKFDLIEKSESRINITKITMEGYQKVPVFKIDYRNSESSNSSTFLKNKVALKKGKQGDHAMNEDWKKMFGPEKSASEKPNFQENLHPAEEQAVPSTSAVITEQNRIPLKKSSFKPVIAPCMISLEKLKLHYEEQFLEERYCIDGVEAADRKEKVLTREWRPSGTMAAHLHEHRGAVNRLAISYNDLLFASCSNDGTVKVWETNRLHGKSITNRSRMTYSKQGGQMKCLCFCDRSQSIASVSDAGSLHMFCVDSVQGKQEPILKKEFDIAKDGMIVDMAPYDAESENIVTYATVNGSIIGWDIRSPNSHAWKVDMNLKYGLITTFDVHKKLGWVAVGTSAGAHMLWDMRFLLPVNTVFHPIGARVRRLMIDQNAQSTVVSSTQDNNELTFIDMETGTKRVLWASECPVLSYKDPKKTTLKDTGVEPSKHSYRGICVGSSFVLTAGSDMRLRYWDLEIPSESYIVAGSANDSENVGSYVSYDSKPVEGTPVIFEVYHLEKKLYDEGNKKASLYFDRASVGHRDMITDLAVCISQQRYIITSSRDGIIKVWK